MERIYTINLYKEWKNVPYWKRTKRCINAIRKFLSRHMKTSPDKVKISIWLNMEIWKNSIKNPPRKIRVKAIKDEKGIVNVELLEKPKKLIKLEKKSKKEEKKENK
ncbi:MAG: 50S ribosomal protein L31e [Candidatus Pacearchaeota archaeon]